MRQIFKKNLLQKNQSHQYDVFGEENEIAEMTLCYEMKKSVLEATHPQNYIKV